jgi:hypothetical protein
MLRDNLTQKTVLLLDTPEHVDSGNINFKIGLPSFFQNVIFYKMWVKLAKIDQIDRFSNFFRLFSRFKAVEQIQ